MLGYLSVGTIENYRPWYKQLKPYRIAPDRNWHGEYYAQVRRRGYRRALTRKIAPKLYAKGFDGLFLDNVDMIENYKRQARGMRKLVAALGRLVHADGGYLFAQNGFSVIRPMLADLDGWNREDVTSTYRFGKRAYAERKPKQIAATQRELRKVGAAGLLVTATDYTAKAGSAVARRAVANACAAGALPYVSDIYLAGPRSRRCGVPLETRGPFGRLAGPVLDWRRWDRTSTRSTGGRRTAPLRAWSIRARASVRWRSGSAIPSRTSGPSRSSASCSAPPASRPRASSSSAAPSPTRTATSAAASWPSSSRPPRLPTPT